MQIREFQKKDESFEKPTARDVNKAIELILWRCRDAELHKNPEGFYRLNDWVTKAMKDKKKVFGFSGKEIVQELGLFCADIQELNIGTRDS